MQCARAATVQSMAVKLLIRNSELQYLITGAPLRLRQNVGCYSMVVHCKEDLLIHRTITLTSICSIALAQQV